ncbi:hypothetical protein [Rhizobium rhizosphaerae]|uniref:hypothetical protein n=1 Tax=Xaviernesmea rhizosphaerae TaxID=1672749 RepID=UPI00117BA226|nr:hypothetical protein [Xaviernesmea rhizosphaerae]
MSIVTRAEWDSASAFLRSDPWQASPYNPIHHTSACSWQTLVAANPTFRLMSDGLPDGRRQYLRDYLDSPTAFATALSRLQDEYAEQGRDWEKVLEHCAAELKKMKGLNLDVSAMQQTVAIAPQPPNNTTAGVRPLSWSNPKGVR